MRQAKQLVLERRYESAWQLLARLDPRNLDPAVAIEKADVALRYYTATGQLTRFAFRDLKLLDLAPDSLRQLGTDSLRYRFAVRAVLERLQRRYPDNYRLARALGDYYYAVQQCDCAEQRLGEDEVFRRTIAKYQQAHEHGQGDYLSYFALGYAYQRLGRFTASLAPFERSLELRPRNPTAHLNLAFVLLELRQLEKARYNARSAQLLFADQRRKDDAGFLLKEIEERIRQTDGKQPPAAPPDTAQTAAPAAAPAATEAPEEAADEEDDAMQEPAVAADSAAVNRPPVAPLGPAAPAVPQEPATGRKSTKSVESGKSGSGKSAVSKKPASSKPRQPPKRQ